MHNSKHNCFLGLQILRSWVTQLPRLLALGWWAASLQLTVRVQKNCTHEYIYSHPLSKLRSVKWLLYFMFFALYQYIPILPINASEEQYNANWAYREITGHSSERPWFDFQLGLNLVFNAGQVKCRRLARFSQPVNNYFCWHQKNKTRITNF